MKRQTDKGAALISALLVMMLMSALLVGLVALVIADQQSLGSGNQQTQAYMGAHAGLEKLTADLGALFKLNYSPTGAQVNNLMATANVPTLQGISFVKPDGTSGYQIKYNADSSGNPQVQDPNGTMISEGPYQGLIGLITPYTMDVTAQTPANAEVRLTRTVQSVAIPVFQFGIFSDKDVSFHAGPNFAFGGRVHTNQNLFVAQGSGTTLLMGDRVTAVGEVIRTHLANGLSISTSGHTGTVRIATQNNGCNPGYTSTTCRPLGYSSTSQEGSVVIGAGGVPPSTLKTITDGSLQMVRLPGETKNSVWGTVLTAYNTFLENGVYKQTGSGSSAVYTPDGGTARRLVLPIVDTDTGAQAIDLIRRPKVGDPTGPGTTFDQRFFRLASLRILLSDTANEIKLLPSIDTSVDPMDLTKYNDTSASPAGFAISNSTPPLAKSDASSGSAMTAGSPLVSGFIKIERQDNNGVWHDVTREILALGIAGRNIATGVANAPKLPSTGACGEPNPDAIIRLQRIADAPQNEKDGGLTNDNDACGAHILAPIGQYTREATNYMPMALYDAREGETTDGDHTGIRLQGVMHYVEFDVNNFKRWLNGSIGSTGATNTMNVTGYVVYFSDRRGNKNAANVETGELGFEDVVHFNNAYDPGENVNENVDSGGNPIFETYGNTPQPPTGATGFMLNPVPASGAVYTNSNLRFLATVDQARKNPPTFFRRALKLVNGGRGQLPHGSAPNSGDYQGLTVASENPVYVEGNYNACGLPTDDCAQGAANDGGFTNDTSSSRHYSAAVIADAVTLLSKNWNDIQSFTQLDARQRLPQTTWYRLAIISGKGIAFPWEDLSSAYGYEADRGSDGGVHNFLRFLEGWGSTGTTSYANYWGSMVSLYYNRQGTGVFKYGLNGTYTPPNRQFKFDNDFLTPSLLPPRTPMFRDINVLTFRESFNPTQP